MAQVKLKTKGEKKTQRKSPSPPQKKKERTKNW